MLAARIEHKEEFWIAGFRQTVQQGQVLDALWKKVRRQAADRGVSREQLKPVGVIVGMNTSGHFDYLAGILVEDLETAKALGFNALKVDGGEFAVTTVTGPAPASTMVGVDQLMGSFLPASGFAPNGPVFEVYGQGDPSAQGFQMQVWVPVKPAPLGRS